MTAVLVSSLLIGTIVAPASATVGDLGVSIGAATVSPSLVVRSTTDATISATITGTFSSDPSPSAVTLGTLETIDSGPSCTYKAGRDNLTVAANRRQTADRTAYTYAGKGIQLEGEAAATPGITRTVSVPVNLAGRLDGAESARLDVTAFSVQKLMATPQTGFRYSYWAAKSDRDPSLEEKCVAPAIDWTDGTPVHGVEEVGTPTALTRSAAFTLDLAPPDVTAAFDGTAPARAPTGGDVDLGVFVRNATPNDGYEVAMAAHFIPAEDENGDPIDTENRMPEEAASFDGSLTTPKTGNNGRDDLQALSLIVPCYARLGDYELRVSVSKLTDLGGSDFDPIELTVGRFEVYPSSELVGTTEIYGYVDTDNDTIPNFTQLADTGFTAVKTPQGKVNTDPGAFYLTNKLKLTSNRGGNQTGGGGDTCNDDVWMNFSSTRNNDGTADLDLVAPTGWAFVKTGQTFAKVFAGKQVGGVFDYSSPVLAGVTPTGGGVEAMLDKETVAAGTSTAPTALSLRLGKLKYWLDTNLSGTLGDLGDTQVSGGRLPGDWYVYTWARVRYVGTDAPPANQSYRFSGLVAVDGLNDVSYRMSKRDEFTLVHAPTQL